MFDPVSFLVELFAPLALKQVLLRGRLSSRLRKMSKEVANHALANTLLTLQVSASELDNSGQHNIGGRIESYFQDWVDSENHRPIVLIGDSGSGKTTLLAHLMDKVQWGGRTPVLIRLASLSADTDLEAQIVDLLSQQLQCSKPLLKSHLEKRCFLLLDGLDELMIKGHNKNILGLVNGAMNLTPRVIVSLRPRVFGREDVDLRTQLNWTKENGSFLVLNALSKEAVQRVFANVDMEDFYNGLPEPVQNLATNPYKLTLLLSMKRDNPSIHPSDIKTECDIYTSFVDHAISRELSKGTLTCGHADIERFFLEIAAQIWISNTGGLANPDLERIHQNYPEVPQISLAELFLYQDSTNTWFFQHQSLLEFFVSRVLLDCVRTEDFTRLGKHIASVVYNEAVSRFARSELNNEYVPKLINLLQSEQNWVRYTAAHFLARLTQTKPENEKKNVRDHLERALEAEQKRARKCKEDLFVVRELYISIAFLGAEDRFHEFVSQLEKDRALADVNEKMIITYLGGSIERAAQGCVKRLDPFVALSYPTREMLLHFLCKHGTRASLPAALFYLDDPIPSVRVIAGRALDRLCRLRVPMPSHNELQALIFDLDGVLIDSIDDHIQEWTSALLQCGLCRPEQLLSIGSKISSFVKRTEGMKPALIAERLLRILDGEIDRKRASQPHIISELAEQKRLHNPSRITPIEEAVDVARLAKSQGKKIAIVTGSSRNRAESANTSLLLHADHIINSESCVNCKPSPEPYEKALEKLNVKPANALVIDNAPLGIQSALAAGICCVGYATTLPKEQLCCADIVACKGELLKAVRSAIVRAH